MAVSASSALRRALDHGKSFLGYKETPPKSNKTRFGKQYGLDGYAWCAMYVWCILQDTGSTAAMVKSASTGAIEAWGKSVGRFSRTPQTGAILILRNSKGATQHTEFVYSWNGKRLLGLGGNTSGGAGSIADGGTVAINDRTALYKKGRITFVRPFYGVTVEDVKTVQRAAGITVDGKIGPKTVASVKTLQARHGLTADGFPGPATIAALTGAAVSDAAAAIPKPSAPSLPSAPAALVEDGKFGELSAKALQGRLGVTQDGKIGPDTIRAWQRHEGTPVDGLITGQPRGIYDAFPAIRRDCIRVEKGSSKLIATVQRNVGVTPDGRAGTDTARAMQHAINTNPGAFVTKAR